MLREIFKYILITSVLFGVVTGVLFAFEDGYTVEWIPMIGTILACAFIITIKNPFNYLAFLEGAVSSLVLTVALWDTNVNGALTYLVVFLPSQIYSFFVWKKKAELAKQQNNPEAAAPRWQTSRERVITAVVLVGFMIVNMVVSYYFAEGMSAAALFFGSLMFATAVVANVTLIYKLIDSRIYWILFSVAGMGVSLSAGAVSLQIVMMFTIFLIINIRVFIDWIKVAK